MINDPEKKGDHAVIDTKMVKILARMKMMKIIGDQERSTRDGIHLLKMMMMMSTEMQRHIISMEGKNIQIIGLHVKIEKMTMRGIINIPRRNIGLIEPPTATETGMNTGQRILVMMSLIDLIELPIGVKIDTNAGQNILVMMNLNENTSVQALLTMKSSAMAGLIRMRSVPKKEKNWKKVRSLPKCQINQEEVWEVPSAEKLQWMYLVPSKEPHLSHLNLLRYQMILGPKSAQC